MKKTVYLFVLFLINLASAQQINIQPSIEVSEVENMLSLKAFVLNNDEVLHDLNYLLVAIKKNGSSNFSTNKQEGQFVIAAFEKKHLSEIRLNISKGDQIKSYLFIRDEIKNELIAKDSILLNYDDKSLRTTNGSNPEASFLKEEFVLKGVVIDQTKTKFGRDFFDSFYSAYNLMNEKFPFIVTITETPSIGRTSIIQIEDRDKLLHSFRVEPKEEYVKMQVDYTLKRLNQYNNELKFIKEQLSAP
ncbi:curli production assembly/transport protein CsgE [Empedobacter falsenii]|uniref:Curli production assembly/transport component CsgE n=1 Tax=Empedobacter falsenii TaxID=343874 RepID=A0ABY8V879_9FLAO|nr:MULTISPECIES: CsgE family curli-type amyloid fiber assembly protein [Empedobacter]MDM1522022.1 hypothetical protein [Empedobacter sp. 225-1]MDM1542291.1 hypothetical protein [Empedobacter sp. 189-2]WIH97532.1 curli production assembly/transport protein CsgE [Empedobacter falsenii]